MDKHQVAAILDEIGTLLELQGESPFRCNAYHNGARDHRATRRRPRHRRARGTTDLHTRHRRRRCATRSPPSSIRASCPSTTISARRRRPACSTCCASRGWGRSASRLLYDQLKHRHARQTGGSLRGRPRGEAEGLRRRRRSRRSSRAFSFSVRWASACASIRALPLGDASASRRCARHRASSAWSCAAACGGGARRSRTSTFSSAPTIRARSWSASSSLPGVVQVIGHGETKSSVIVRRRRTGC